MIINVVITLSCATVGAVMAKKMKLPLPFFLGSILGAACYNLITGSAYLWPEIKTFVQIISGAFLGGRFTKNDIRDIKKNMLPILLLLSMFTLNTLLCGGLVHFLASTDYLTGFFGCIPGGLSEITIQASYTNADLVAVTMMQLCRQIFSLIVLPSFLLRKYKKNEYINKDESLGNKSDNRSFVITLLIASIAGYVGKASGLAAGTLLFSMIAVMLYNFKTEKAYIPMLFKEGCKIFTGAIIGCSITWLALKNIVNFIVPIIIILTSYTLLMTVYSKICVKMNWMDSITSKFAAIPAGVSDMALIASELNVDLSRIAVIQVMRLLYVSAIMPMLVQWLASIL